jgi:hypothetical protein
MFSRKRPLFEKEESKSKHRRRRLPPLRKQKPTIEKGVPSTEVSVNNLNVNFDIEDDDNLSVNNLDVNFDVDDDDNLSVNNLDVNFDVDEDDSDEDFIPHDDEGVENDDVEIVAACRAAFFAGGLFDHLTSIVGKKKSSVESKIIISRISKLLAWILKIPRQGADGSVQLIESNVFNWLEKVISEPSLLIDYCNTR